MANTTTKQNQTLEPSSQLDRVAAAKAKAQAYLQGNQDQMGTIYGLTEGCTAYWFVPAEVGDGRADSLRRDLSARGYESAPEASVAGVGQAEVWEIPMEVADMLFAARKQRDREALGQARLDN